MRKILLSAMLLAAGVASAQTTNYTLTDVAKHATATDCWMVLNTNKVYNFTPFVTMHPGGTSSLVAYCGKNGDPGFASVNHTSNAVALEPPYLIGALVAAPAPISVALTPANSTVSVGVTEQFTATVANSTAGVAWHVAPASLGSISASGLFIGLVAGQGTVTAASTQDSSKSATATVTVQAVAPPPPSAIVVTVSPSALSLNTNTNHQFTANVTNSTQGVTWTAAKALGTMSNTGVLKAAMTPATGKVTATSVQDPTKSSSVQVTLTAVTPVPPTSCQPSSGSGGDDNGGHGSGKDD